MAVHSFLNLCDIEMILAKHITLKDVKCTKVNSYAFVNIDYAFICKSLKSLIYKKNEYNWLMYHYIISFSNFTHQF